ncbi:MAG TPA: hypothetical protein VIU61_07010 [Kofleriaceae bacterium]
MGSRFIVAIVVGACAAGTAFAQPDPPSPQPPPDPPTDPAPVEPEPAPPPEPAPAPAPAPAPVPPPQPVAPPQPVEGYPLALAARPLFLPASGFEVGGLVLLGLQDFESESGEDTFETVFLRPGFRYGFSGAELELGMDVLVHQGEIEGVTLTNDDPVARLYAAGRFEVSPDVALGGELTVSGPTSDFKVYSPRAIVANKQRFGGRGAVELSAGAGLDHRPAVESEGFEVESSSAMVVGGQLRVQAQITPIIAAEARAQIRYFKSLEDETEGNPFVLGEYFAQDYGLRVVGAVSPDLDLIGGLDILSTGEANYKIVSFGVAYRRVP